MASLPACACCGDPVSTAPLGLCGTCLENSGDGDGTLCHVCFALHEKGAAGKGPTRGHALTSVRATIDDSATAVLVEAGLAPCATRCAEHITEPLRIACNTCHEPALCALCAISRHAGHSLIVAAEAAPAARAKLREAARDPATHLARVQAPTETLGMREALMKHLAIKHSASAPLASGPAAPAPRTDATPPALRPTPAPIEESALVSAARAHSQRVYAELSELPGQVEAAEQRIEELRSTLFAAVDARCAALLADLVAGASRVREDIDADLERADALLRDATSVATNLVTAADTLSDIDVVCHADALLARAAGVKSAVAALPPRPAVSSAISVEITPAGKAALLGSIYGLGNVVTGLAAVFADGTDDDTLEAKGARVSALRASGYDAATFRAARFDVAVLRAGGFDLAALQAGGFDPAALYAGGFNVASLRAGGFDDAALFAAGLLDQDALFSWGISRSIDGSC